MAVLIASSSVLVAVAAKVNKPFKRHRLKIYTKRPANRLGVFVSGGIKCVPICGSGLVKVCRFISWLLFLAISNSCVAAEACPAVGEVEQVSVAQVVDGDSLRLADGRSVRLIAVNTPEFANRGRAEQPLAKAAAQEVKAFLSGGQQIAIQLGEQQRDRYGRYLAHVFRADGVSLAGHLLAAGLGWQLVIPPNDRYWQCLASQELLARTAAIGVWQAGAYPLLDAGQLTVNDTGFQRVRGIVRSVQRSRDSWWLQLDNLAIQLRDKHVLQFGKIDPSDWQGQPLTIRGWVVDRSASPAVRKGQYSALMINLEHPSMLK